MHNPTSHKHPSPPVLAIVDGMGWDRENAQYRLGEKFDEHVRRHEKSKDESKADYLEKNTGEKLPI